jgi:hypothetical protein
MNPRNTWRWIIVAVALFAFILVHQKYLVTTGGGPGKVLPRLRAAAVTSLQVRPAARLEIRAERTNGTWQLTAPLAYPAQAVSIEKLLVELERLAPAPYITARELQGRPQTDQEYGFAAPQASLIIEQPGYTYRLRVGANTAPGDQVFLQVLGVEGIYVVNADFLKYLPQTADDWRNTALLDLQGLAVDWLAVTNGPKIFQLQRDASSKLWRMTYPLQARANSAKVEESLQMLQNVRVLQFVPDDPKMDVEMFGLQPPELEVALGQGSNIVAVLQFGKCPTNDTRLVYARRLGLNAVVAVAKDLLAPWYASVNDFRDPFLATLSAPVAVVDVRGQDHFSLQPQTNGLWRVLPQGFPADAGLVKELLSALSALPIVEFTKDVVIAPDLPAYGLAPSVRQYILKSAMTNPADGATNSVIAELAFGTNQADKVFARRADESFVYAVRLADFQRLPAAGWQMRDRRIWDFSTNDVARAVIREQGRVRQIVRNGPYNWSLAPGSQGAINDLAVEETVSGLCRLTAVGWLARGEPSRPRFGLTEQSRQITLELKNGDKTSVQFCGEAAASPPCAAVTLDGELWIFEFPAWLYEYVQRYLLVPPNP